MPSTRLHAAPLAGRAAVALRLAPIVVAAAALGVTPDALAAELRPLRADEVLERIREGEPVVERGVEIRGVLDLPPEVRVPLVIRSSRITGDVIADSTTFSSIVDFGGSVFHGRLEFTSAEAKGPFLLGAIQAINRATAAFNFALFHRVVHFEGAAFAGGLSFWGSHFGGLANLRAVRVDGPLSFDQASFAQTAQFDTALLGGDATFGLTDFRSTGDFTGVAFGGVTSFADARFGGEAGFAGATFGHRKTTSFVSARFDDGATFASAFFAGPADFGLSTSAGDLDFERATFEGNAEFSTVRFSGRTTLAGATFGGDVNFDQAIVSSLDLDDVDLGSNRVVLPELRPAGSGQRSGRVESMRLDPEAVDHIQVGRERAGTETRQEALEFVERVSKDAGDLAAANQAREKRLTLKRETRSVGVEQLDRVFYWEFAGYFVKWWHPVRAILTLFLLATALRLWRRRALLRSWRAVKGRTRDALRESFRSVWQLRPTRASVWRWFETYAHKTLLAVLLTCVANTWPPVHDLLKGVLP